MVKKVLQWIVIIPVMLIGWAIGLLGLVIAVPATAICWIGALIRSRPASPAVSPVPPDTSATAHP